MKAPAKRQTLSITPPSERKLFIYQPVIQVILLIAVIWFVWKFSIQNGLTNWDDEGYITKNELMNLPFPSAQAHFSTYIMGNYHPLTTLSLHWDTYFWENPVAGYHWTNLILHALNTLLVFMILRQMPGAGNLAFPIALIFAIHPLHVESVAWVSERKDVLYSLFFLLALLVQTLWLNQKLEAKVAGMAVLLFFILSALSKAVAVTLGPILLLNLWYWGKFQYKKEWWIPGLVILLSLGIGILAILAQQSSDSIKSVTENSIWMRPAFALFALSAYIGKIMLPIRLSCFYPYPAIGDWLVWLGVISMLALGGVVWLRRKKISPLTYYGMGFFLLNLLPILQLLPVGEALYADRYVYLAILGFLLAIGGFLPEKRIQSIPGWILILAIGIPLSYLTIGRIPVWKDSLALWTNMIQTYPNAYFVAYNNRAIALHEKQLYAEALRDFDHAISLYPAYKDALYNRGTSRAAVGDKEGAILDFTAAIQLQEDFYLAWYNRGNSFAMMGKMEEAEKDYLKTVQINPSYPEAWTNLGNVYGMRKESAKAEASYTKSIELQPENAQAFNNRALSRVALGDTTGAISDFETAISIYEKANNKAAADETRRNRQLMNL